MARQREAAVSATEAKAWQDELTRPAGVSEVVDSLLLADLARQLAALPDHQQHQLLVEYSPRGHAVRRAVYGRITLQGFGLGPQTEAAARAGVVERRGPSGAAAAEARDLQQLATVLRRAVGLVGEPVIDSRRGTP